MTFDDHDKKPWYTVTVIQQHYVPRVYLRNFADADEQVYVYNKVDAKTFHTNIKNIAAERYFYDVPHIDRAAGRQVVEEYLSRYEGYAKQVFDGLLIELDTLPQFSIRPEYRAFLSVMIALQLLRSRDHRIVLGQLMENLKKEIARRHGNDPAIAAAVDAQFPLSDEDVANMHSQSLLDTGRLLEYTNSLNSHIWMILEQRTNSSFYTSDNPVVRRPHVTSPGRSMSGIASRGIEIAFPISPRFCLLLYERSHFMEYEPFDNQKVPFFAVDENVIHYNHLQVISSTRHVVSKYDDLAFAHTVCTEEPGVRNVDRARVTVS